jgi:iron-sulfur cluster assembly accessory protein
MNATLAAQAKVSQLIVDSQIAMPDHPLFLRIAVQPGGCSGLRYQTYFDYEKKEGDKIYPFDKFDLVIDRMSMPYLSDATLDFVDTIEKQGFTIDNPGAVGSCACGDSFH